MSGALPAAEPFAFSLPEEQDRSHKRIRAAQQDGSAAAEQKCAHLSLRGAYRILQQARGGLVRTPETSR
ncbi:hypothetical protein B484DRAFT_451862 [Ochromonadaceae sp. CCMP2298]|nr:hypothetical protein B484DRAFT_451862 [Ochromonadaceae sp. CCMP2298]